MKSVTFSGKGSFEVTLSVDFTYAKSGGAGDVRFGLAGIDVNRTDPDSFPAKVWGWYTPAEAREIARYLNEMADKAEAGEQ